MFIHKYTNCYTYCKCFLQLEAESSFILYYEYILTFRLYRSIDFKLKVEADASDR